MRRFCLMVLAFGAGAGCSSESSTSGDDDDGGGSSTTGYCGALTGRLRDCGALGAGRFSCTNYDDSAEECETECVRAASCPSLTEFLCAFDGSTARCFQECSGISPFACDDGSVIAGYERCDSAADCANGEDELDCASIGGYKCRNVDQRVSGELFCDGIEDCRDGSDEPPDCETKLVCDDGIAIAEFEVCNGVQRCLDGADEPAACAVLSCG